jgi:hypothetical protein
MTKEKARKLLEFADAPTASEKGNKMPPGPSADGIPDCFYHISPKDLTEKKTLR